MAGSLPILCCCLVLAGCGRPPLLEQIQSQGELIVITRNSPTTYYEGPDGPAGFEHDLASRFADYLGVELRLVVPPNFNDILPLVVRGSAHLAAAGLSVTEKRKEKVRFGPAYHKITPQLVYRTGTRRPKSLSDIKGHLEVLADSSHAERLLDLVDRHPELVWEENNELDSEELLYLVWEEVIDYTVADSDELKINQHYYPELRPAFAIGDPEPLAWAFAQREDDSLYNKAFEFFEKITSDGTLDQLVERYYGHIQKFDYVGTRSFQRQIEQRLPEFRELFVEAGETLNLDWRLLAAIGYQESHWDPAAVSPTGVRGIMMLTRDAAKDLDIKDRRAPRQSISGGAEYFLRMHRRIPERIAEPDRTWLALAAYNIGIGHLEDARILTQMNDGDPDKWIDVKENLPLLSKKKWFQKTRYGYARGREPVRYVENIRTYYDILVWHTERNIEVRKTPWPLLLAPPAL